MKRVKRIFITGISGFIGMHLALALKARGDFVMGCDNFNTYYDVRLKKERTAQLNAQSIDVIACDIADRAMIEHALATHEITHFVHLAAQAGVRHSMKDPLSYVHSNLYGFVQILEALRNFAHIPLVYASSSSVYGLNKKVPFAETDPTDEPTSFYGATKKSNELIAKSYHHMYGISCTGLRFFTAYGPWGRPDMAYYSFSKAMIEGNPIPVFGNGQLLRDFTYIDDIVNGIISAISLEAKCEIFNLGNNKPQSVLDLVALLEKHLNKKAKIEFLPTPLGDVPITYADIQKSQNILGFQPVTSFDEGIHQFAQWFLKYEKRIENLIAK